MTPKEDLERLKKALEGDKRIDAALVKRLAREAPYFALPAALALRHIPADAGEEDIERWRRRVALTASDAASFAASGTFYPDEKGGRPETADAITTFLEVYGHAPTAEEDALLERMIMNPVPDYAATLEAEAEVQEAEASGDSQDAMIAAFLDSRRSESESPSPAPATVTSTDVPDADPSSPLAASLAKLFVRQGHYAKAYEMLKQLNLNNPEKSVYFATQLRFLRKLMANQQASRKPQ